MGATTGFGFVAACVNRAARRSPSCPPGRRLYGQYSYRCREQAWESTCNSGGGWEQSAPQKQRPGSIVRSGHVAALGPSKTAQLCCSLKAFSPCWPDWRTVLRSPTILAWDWPAAGRILRLEANSP